MERILALVLLTAPAVAQEPGAAARVQAQFQAQSPLPGHNPADCYCRANGRTFPVGDHVCLRTAEGPRVAECQMVLNVTSWGLTEKPCPES